MTQQGPPESFKSSYKKEGRIMHTSDQEDVLNTFIDWLIEQTKNDLIVWKPFISPEFGQLYTNLRGYVVKLQDTSPCFFLGGCQLNTCRSSEILLHAGNNMLRNIMNEERS